MSSYAGHWIPLSSEPSSINLVGGPMPCMRTVYLDLMRGWYVVVCEVDDKRARPVAVSVSRDGSYSTFAWMTAEGAKAYLRELGIEPEARDANAQRLTKMLALVRQRQGGVGSE